MKTFCKISLSLILISGVFFPQLTLATSGACSSHGGVNCAAGATSLGRVRCNDGWVNSSVYFVEAQECKNESSCSYPVVPGCDVEYAKQQAQENAARINSQNRISAVQGGLSVPMTTQVDYTQDSNYIACKKAEEFAQFKLDLYNACIDDRNRERAEEQKVFEDAVNRDFELQMNSYCTEENGVGSLWDKSIGMNKYNDPVCTLSVQQKFDKAFDEIYYKAFVDYPDLPKNVDKEAIKKIAITPEYRNTPVSDIIRKYAIDNKLLMPVIKAPESQVVTIKETPVKSTTLENVKQTTPVVRETILKKTPAPVQVKEVDVSNTIPRAVSSSESLRATTSKDVFVPQPQPKPRSLWSRILGWFKTW